MPDIVQVQLIQTTAYFKQLQEQFTHIENEIESGKTVTLTFTDKDRSISLEVSRDDVVEVAAPAAPPATRRSRLLAHNESIIALMSNSYTFDIDEANREITTADIQAHMTRAANESAVASTERPASSDSDFPDAVVTQITGSHDWIVREDYAYKTNHGVTVTVKSGFRTDLASVPRIFWPLIAPTDLSLAAPTIHDLIYRSIGKVALPDGEVLPGDKLFSREDADSLFLEVMTLAKIRSWKRKVAFKAVRHFGESSWRKHD